MSNHDNNASVPCLFDYDGDGDLDLLVGNFNGRVILIPNRGFPTDPRFDGAKRRPLMAAGKVIQVPMGDAGPVMADWDGDGLVDLLVGAADGSVGWYRNTGKKGAPEFAAGVALLPATALSWENPVPLGGAPSGPGWRAKICVTDWNGDGRLDLLVGDVWYERGPEPFLQDDQRERLVELRAKKAELIRALAGKSDDEPQVQEMRKELGAVYAELGRLESRRVTRGSVWLFLREPKPAPAK